MASCQLTVHAWLLRECDSFHLPRFVQVSWFGSELPPGSALKPWLKLIHP